MKDGDRVICDFRVEHEPLEYNYAHSEIRVYRQGERITEATRKKIPKVERKRFRLAIMEEAEIVVDPLI